MALVKQLFWSSVVAPVAIALLLASSPWAASVVRFLCDIFVMHNLSPTDGREQRLLHYVLANSKQGSPQDVLKAVDDYAWSKEWFMNIGDVKGKLVQQAIANMSRTPQRLLELGTYCGYGSITIATSIDRTTAKLYTVEPLDRNADVAQAMFDHAGLQGSIVILRGTLTDHVASLKQRLGAPLDFIFLDHKKELYVSDLKLLQAHGLLDAGSVVVADNIWLPGAPEYYKFMESATDFDTVWHVTQLEYVDINGTDMLGVSTFLGPAVSDSRPGSEKRGSISSCGVNGAPGYLGLP